MSIFSISIFLIIVIIFLVLSGFISAVETAFTSASKAKLHTYIKKGYKNAAEVEHLKQNNMSEIIGALLALETIFETSATAIATAALAISFNEFGIAIGTVVMSLLIMIYGEILPKLYAFQYPEEIAMKTVSVLRVILNVCKPIVALTNLIARRSLGVFGVKTKESGDNEHVEELKGAISLHAKLGSKAQNEKLMLESILDLADVDVDEIMTHRKNMVIIDANSPLEQVLEQVLSSPYTRHPVWLENRENIVGILHTKDLLRALTVEKTTDAFDLEAVCSKPWFIPESTSLFDQLNAFRMRREHLACVVDEYGALLGLVSLEDILEEIVGQIDDEHDILLSQVHKEAGSTFSVHGWSTLRDLNREFDLDLPDNEATTIAGLIIHEIENIPDVGKEFMLHGLRCKILAKKRNQVTLIRITYDPHRKNKIMKSPPIGEA
jgi:Mg2+/Co2+ transporter CorB